MFRQSAILNIDLILIFWTGLTRLRQSFGGASRILWIIFLAFQTKAKKQKS
jgi:hypothetical protein